MDRLRRAWLVGIACIATTGAASALVMRVELLDPGKTLSTRLYSSALSLHAWAMLGTCVAAFIAIPTLVIRAGRAAVVLGAIAFAAWAAAMAFFIVLTLAPAAWIPALHVAPILLAVVAALAIAQLATSLPTERSIAAIGGIAALAIFELPLASGVLPTQLYLLVATTVAVCSFAIAVKSAVWAVVTPCLAAAWLATVFLHVAHGVYLPDTVAMLAPLPALGGALLGALFVACMRDLPRVPAALFTIGSIGTSLGLLVLGTHGMPRRYQLYDGSFQPLQIAVGVAAAVTVIGAIAAVRATSRTSR